VIACIPMCKRSVEMKVRLGVKYVPAALELLHKRLPSHLYYLVSGADVAILAVTLASTDEPRVVEGVLEVVRKQIERCHATMP